MKKRALRRPFGTLHIKCCILSVLKSRILLFLQTDLRGRSVPFQNGFDTEFGIGYKYGRPHPCGLFYIVQFGCRAVGSAAAGAVTIAFVVFDLFVQLLGVVGGFLPDLRAFLAPCRGYSLDPR